MSTPEPPQDWGTADEEWLHELCHPGSAAAQTDAAREARMLHRALAGERDAIEGSPLFARLANPDRQEDKLQALLVDLRQRRLLEAPRRRWQPMLWSLGLAAAAVVGWFALAPLFTQTLPPPVYSEPPTWRGEVSVVQRPVADPRREAEALLLRLQQVGIEASIHQRGAVFIVDVLVPADPPAVVAEALRSEGVALVPLLTRLEFLTK